MFAIVPLLADFLDWAPIVVFLVITVMGAINQMISKNREAIQKKGRPPRPAGQGAGAGAQRDEIEQFLRDVVQRREGGGPPRKVPPQVREVEIIEPPEKGPRRLVEARQEFDSTRKRKRAQKQKPASKKRSKPQTKVELADERLTKRLHSVFDHEVGSPHVDSGVDEKVSIFQQPQFKQQIATSSVTAAGLSAMLTDQQNLKQAIVLMEILKRPEERW